MTCVVQIADLTLAIARLHKAVNAAPTKKELHEISEQVGPVIIGV